MIPHMSPFFLLMLMQRWTRCTDEQNTSTLKSSKVSFLYKNIVRQILRENFDNANQSSFSGFQPFDIAVKHTFLKYDCGVRCPNWKTIEISTLFLEPTKRKQKYFQANSDDVLFDRCVHITFRSLHSTGFNPSDCNRWHAIRKQPPKCPWKRLYEVEHHPRVDKRILIGS